MSESSGVEAYETSEGFSDEERQAIKDRAAELKTASRRGRGASKAAAEEADVLKKIAAMPDGDRELAERVHAIVKTVAPELAPKLYYGQPGYARNGKVLCFFRSGQGDKERYSTFGFSVQANLDQASGVWPTAFALVNPTEAAWEQLGQLVKQSVA
jgi:hypothetical protein